MKKYLLISIISIFCSCSVTKIQFTGSYITEIIDQDTIRYRQNVILELHRNYVKFNNLKIENLYYFDGNKAEGTDKDGNTYILVKLNPRKSPYYLTIAHDTASVAIGFRPTKYFTEQFTNPINH